MNQYTKSRMKAALIEFLNANPELTSPAPAAELGREKTEELRRAIDGAVAICVGDTWVRFCNFNGCIPAAANDPTVTTPEVDPASAP